MSLLSRTPALALLALSLAGGAVQAGKIEDAVDYRQGVMNIFSWNAGHMAAMAKGEIPFDAAAFQGYAADLAATAALNILPGFPEESITDDSDAKDEIWLNWSDFEAKLQDLRRESAKLKELAASGDEAAIKAQLDATRRTCKACHDDYKQ
ncbi:MAG: c-type cytochrome [Bdellovibrio bacteriovorus]